jgi:glycosyltransferase involved in cell wall biosynthesis
VSRLAFVSPVPPASSGIADYSADVLALLAGRHAIDVFHGQEAPGRERLPASCGLHHAGSFLARHRERPYDLAIYQLGNAPLHAFAYDLMARVPGLLVLHDLVLHHSRARMLLDTPEARAYEHQPWSEARRVAARPALDAYEAELAYTYGNERAERLAATQLATVGDLLPYAYPLFRIPVEAARVTAVHNDFMAEAVRAEVPEAEVVRIPMAAERVSVKPEAIAALRARYGSPPDAFVVASFGLLTREKRLESVARAVARVAATLPTVRLLLVGPCPDADALAALLARLGVAQRAIVPGRVAFEELAAHMELADLVVHLRYPTARETSAALLRVLAQGRPTVMADLQHLADVPEDAVLRADPTDEEGEVTRAILRLAERPQLWARLGQRASAFVAREHSPARCRASYEAAIERALALPDPAPREWPAHWQR